MRALLRASFNDLASVDDMRDRLAESPHHMADAIVEMEDTQRYMLWGMAILGFLVWVALISRRY